MRAAAIHGVCDAGLVEAPDPEPFDDYALVRVDVAPMCTEYKAAGTATYAQKLLKRDALLLPIPDDASTDHGAMACCGLGPTFAAMERMGGGGLDTVLIVGPGPVGPGGVVNGVVSRFDGNLPSSWARRRAGAGRAPASTLREARRGNG